MKNEKFNIEYHTRAVWLGSIGRVVKQYLVSTISYLTYPFIATKADATKKYFQSIYNNTLTDDLLFDGKNSKYFEKILNIYCLNKFEKKDVIDIGCGEAAFFFWLNKVGVTPNRYLGVDIAHPATEITESAKIVNSDIENYPLGNDTLKPSVLILSNSLCYINDKRFDRILKESTSETEALIIEPIPGLFWDAHFSEVKLYYRELSKIVAHFESFGWAIQGICIDYLISCRFFTLFPLSVCIYTKKLIERFKD